MSKVNPYEKLKQLFNQLAQLENIQGIAVWDESVMMPEGAGTARGNALAALDSVISTKLRKKKVSDLISAAKEQII